MKVAPLLDLDHLYDDAPLSKPLRTRLAWTLRMLQRDPQASLPKALGPAGYTGLLRLVHHRAVSVGAIREPVLAQTRAEARAFPSVLAIHDTTEFAFGGTSPRAGLGRLRTTGQGFFFHPCLLVSDDAQQLPLGVIDAETWVRPPQPKPKSKGTPTRQAKAWRRVVNDTESARWSAQIQRVDASIRDATHAVLHVADREGNDFTTFAEAAAASRRFVVRMGTDRLVVSDADDPTAADKVRAVFAHDVEGICTREVSLSARTAVTLSQRKHHPTRRTRTAHLVFQARTVVLRRPQSVHTALPATLPMNVVRVWEPDPPPGEAPVAWMLFTSEPIATAAQVLRVVDAYRARWLIEEFFKALKTGCAYERAQAESYDTLQKLLWLRLPIATNLLRLRELAASTPEASATCANTGLEADALAVLTADRRSAQNGPWTVVRVLYAIARLGGHLPNNGPPGWLVLTRGFHALQLRVEGWRLAMRTTLPLPPKTDRS